MGRILGLDFGIKKCGLAATDELQLIVNALEAVPTVDLLNYFKKYLNQEKVDKLVIGLPTHIDGNDTYLKPHIDVFVMKIKEIQPDLIIDFEDERLTSVRAKEIILQSGIRKSRRRDKTLVDKISAVLILQKYLGHF